MNEKIVPKLSRRIYTSYLDFIPGIRVDKLKIFDAELCTDFIYGSTRDYNIAFIISVEGNNLKFHANIDSLHSQFTGEVFKIIVPVGVKLIIGIDQGIKEFVGTLEYRYWKFRDNPSKLIEKDVKAWLEKFVEEDEIFGLNQISV